MKNKKQNIEYKLIIYKDVDNSLNWIIICLMEVCNHANVQAEQCAYINHYTGNATIKRGSKESLEPLRKELENRTLTVLIKSA